MHFFGDEGDTGSVIVQAAQKSPQLWALGLGTLLFNGIVLTLGNAYLAKTLAAEEEIRDLKARIAELEEGDTVEGLAHRLADVESKTDDLEIKTNEHDD